MPLLQRPSTPKKVRFGGRECPHFNPEFATPPGPRVAPHGKMDNLKKAPCKERTTFLAGARNPEIPGGGILRHREAEDRRPPGDEVEPERKAESAELGPTAGCLPGADSRATQQALLSARWKCWVAEPHLTKMCDSTPQACEHNVQHVASNVAGEFWCRPVFDKRFSLAGFAQQSNRQLFTKKQSRAAC